MHRQVNFWVPSCGVLLVVPGMAAGCTNRTGLSVLVQHTLCLHTPVDISIISCLPIAGIDRGTCSKASQVPFECQSLHRPGWCEVFDISCTIVFCKSMLSQHLRPTESALTLHGAVNPPAVEVTSL